jgi:hypothetical protein
MSRSRSIDYDEARRLRAIGLSYREIARRMKTSPRVVARACDERQRLAQIVAATEWCRLNPQSHRDAQLRYFDRKRQEQRA